MSGAAAGQQAVLATPTPTPTPAPTPTPTPAPTPTPTPTPPPEGWMTVGVLTIGPIKGVTSFLAGFDSVLELGSISPTTLAGATIDALIWSSNSGFASLGTLSLSLNGDTGVGVHAAIVNGADLGASAAGSYSGGATTYAWSGVPNPFGTVDGAFLTLTLS
jgi:hypothetical protein